MGREPISDDTRQAVIAAIRAGGACRAIAREHGVSPAFVSKLAKALGEEAAFDRQAHTAKAADARVFDAKAARAAAVQNLYQDFERFRSRIWDPYTQIITGPSGAELITTKMPPLRDQQAGMVAAAVCLDKALVLEKHDDTAGAEAGKTMINDLFGALGMAYAKIVSEDKATDINAETGDRVTAEQADAAKAAQVREAEQATTGPRKTGDPS